MAKRRSGVKLPSPVASTDAGTGVAPGPPPGTGVAGEAARRWAASGSRNGSSRWASTTSSSGHTDRSGSQGSSPGASPLAAAVAWLTSAPGKGKAMLAHTPSARSDGRAQPVGKPLRQPAFHASGRNGDDLGGHRVRQRLRQHLAKDLDQEVRSLRAMDVQHSSSFSHAAQGTDPDVTAGDGCGRRSAGNHTGATPRSSGWTQGCGLGAELVHVAGVDFLPAPAGLPRRRLGRQVVSEKIEAGMPPGGVASAFPSGAKVSSRVSVVRWPSWPGATSSRMTSVPQRNSRIVSGSNRSTRPSNDPDSPSKRNGEPDLPGTDDALRKPSPQVVGFGNGPPHLGRFVGQLAG